jgi:hypothetical protein
MATRDGRAGLAKPRRPVGLPVYHRLSRDRRPWRRPNQREFWRRCSSRLIEWNAFSRGLTEGRAGH